MNLDTIELNLFANRMGAVCDEMGVVLRRASVSTNIKDRLDYSCAVFDQAGGLIAQAAHIPVHLGSMAYAMRGLASEFDWQPGDCLLINNPFAGGTHLPDVTLISPFFVQSRLRAFVANRAHHADIGADQPGSMPVSESILDEGLILGPCFLLRADGLQAEAIADLANLTDDTPARFEDWRSHPHLADFFAQTSANRRGLMSLEAVVAQLGEDDFQKLIGSLNDYGRRLAMESLRVIPDGRHCFSDQMDKEDTRGEPLRIQLALTADKGRLTFDFSGTSPQSRSNLNCPVSVTAAAAFYVVRTLLPAHTPTCDGLFSSINLQVPATSLLNAEYPAAVAAGNVETSMRIVDVILGALAEALPQRIPAAAQGTMNNVALGGRLKTGASFVWDYYETIAGGLGAHADGDGLSAVQAHMTNTLNTPIESLELHYPLRIKRYALRRGSGGIGKTAGGDGVVRVFEFLEPTHLSLLTERRRFAPWGLAGGNDGRCGENLLNGKALDSQVVLLAQPGDELSIHTPGGGGYGQANP